MVTCRNSTPIARFALFVVIVTITARSRHARHFRHRLYPKLMNRCSSQLDARDAMLGGPVRALTKARS